jgi:hypothetical protein
MLSQSSGCCFDIEVTHVASEADNQPPDLRLQSEPVLGT